jgi:hypothetical protein
MKRTQAKGILHDFAVGFGGANVPGPATCGSLPRA